MSLSFRNKTFSNKNCCRYTTSSCEKLYRNGSSEGTPFPIVLTCSHLHVVSCISIVCTQIKDKNVIIPIERNLMKIARRFLRARGTKRCRSTLISNCFPPPALLKMFFPATLKRNTPRNVLAKITRWNVEERLTQFFLLFFLNWWIEVNTV